MKSITFPNFGRTLIILGILGFLGAIIISFTKYSGFDQGALPAASFLVILLGMAFAFPTMLQESNGQLSTMRIIVFAVTLVFCVMYIKIGWTVGSFENFTIDKSWIYILGLAFGSKAFQKFGEDNTPDNGSNSVDANGDNANNNKPAKA